MKTLKRWILADCISRRLVFLIDYGPEGQRFESTTSSFSARARLFELMAEEKYQIIHMFYMGLVVLITSR
jgi:hypothetical protein